MAATEGTALRTLVLVGVIAVGAAALVSGSYEFSRDRIEANRQARLLQELRSVLDSAGSEAALNPTRIQASDPQRLGYEDPVDVYIVQDVERPRAAVFPAVAPDGYHAPIHLLIGVSADGVVTGVRVIEHRETPGLGDVIEIGKSDWIVQFDGKSLTSPQPPQWAVDDDDGSFDSITGATVTARAVVAGVRSGLEFYEARREELFARAADEATDTATENATDRAAEEPVNE